VKFVRKVESFFEKYIEGFFNKELASGLQPAEIAKRLVKEMENNKTVGVAKIYAPNEYAVYLSVEDYNQLAPYASAIARELAEYVMAEAAKRGYTVLGKPTVKIELDESITKTKFKIVSGFASVPEEQLSSADGEDTKVFVKNSFIHSEEPRPRILARLKVVAGADRGREVELGRHRVNIGRWEHNELSLTDMNTSRLHAYVTFEDDHHVLHDAQSLNGTYVNGRRVMRKQLEHGDQIKMGNTVILYEVI